MLFGHEIIICSLQPFASEHFARAEGGYRVRFPTRESSLPGRSKEACLDRATSRTWSSSGEHAEDKTAAPHILRRAQ
jgi:hypothetical protein